MDKQAIFERVRRLCSEHFGVREEIINLNTAFVDDLKADSLDLVELTMLFEDDFSKKGFDLEVTDEEAENLSTVGDVVDFLAKKLEFLD